MRAGQLRHRVKLQGLGTRVDDGAGGGSIVFADVATVWANVEPLTGQELFNAQAFDPKITHRITTRYYPGIRPSWRVVLDDDPNDNTRVFDIKSAADLEERHIEVVMHCEELLSW